METVSKAFGAALAADRTAAGWTQEELAEKAGTTQQNIGNLENGRSKKPRPELWHRLVEVLGPSCTIAYLQPQGTVQLPAGQVSEQERRNDRMVFSAQARDIARQIDLITDQLAKDQVCAKCAVLISDKRVELANSQAGATTTPSPRPRQETQAA